jgi:hypothetical protein
MQKPTKRTSRFKIETLPTNLTADQLLLVGGGQEHDCVTASGADCEGDDCGPIWQGSHCGP